MRRAVAADELDVRPAPTRTDRPRRRRLRRAGAHTCPPRPAGAGLADRALRPRSGAPRDRTRVADRGRRRGRALLVPHDAAPAARRSRAAVPARRAHRADASPDPRAAGRAAPARPREPVRRVPDLGGEPRALAPPGALRGGGRVERAARDRARCVLQRRDRPLAPRPRDAARTRVVRNGREARVHRRRPARRDGHRERLRVGRLARSTTSTRPETTTSACRRTPIRASRAR